MALSFCIGIALLILSVGVQSLVTVALIALLRKAERTGWYEGPFIRIAVMLQAIAALLAASFLLQTALWAAVFLALGEFNDFATAYYHSAVNYATLGYGDIVMSESRRLLGPLQAINGLLMGGFSASVLFSAGSRIFEKRKLLRK